MRRLPALKAPTLLCSARALALSQFATAGVEQTLTELLMQTGSAWKHAKQPHLQISVLLCSARAHVLSQFAAAGVDTSRVDLLALAAANSDHLGTYSQMDISLDPFPYAGTTTTCESLYMGVPVVTLQGALRSCRVTQDAASYSPQVCRCKFHDCSYVVAHLHQHCTRNAWRCREDLELSCPEPA